MQDARARRGVRLSAEGLVQVQEAAEVQAGSERVMTEQESRRAEHEVQGLVQEAQEVC